MQWMQDFPVAARLIAVLLACAGAWIGTRGVRLFIRGFCRPGDASAPLWIVRGIRGFVVAAGAGALAAGMIWAKTWLVFFGVVFLAEEIYETGVLALILRVAGAKTFSR
jgi:hypothetical protein